jgi:hypothetical protein
MANPQVNPGTLNLLLASVSVPNLTALNVTAPFLTRAGIDVSFNGQSTVMIEAMVGAVTSPMPYMMASVSINLLKTNGIAQAYKNQMELSTLIGPITVRPDVSSGLGPYTFQNCAIEGVSPMTLNGSVASWTVSITGTYYLNSTLFT